MSGGVELGAVRGFVEPAVQAEFPGLRLDWITVRASARASPRELKERLAQLSSRQRGADVVAMRTRAVPHAYRAFFRQIGLDPDVTRIPSERAAVDRLLHGQFQPRNLVDDALLIALVETGIPVWALDAGLLAPGGLGIRTSVAGDRLGRADYGHRLPSGQLVVADALGVHALLFGDVAPGHGVSRRSAEIVVFSVAVDGVPAMHVAEALWVCVDALECGRHPRPGGRGRW
jgi:DNA/RNA-binding domain of Phe-tRNA-synthetase-like protein